jgi:beta-lactamase class C
MRYDRLILTAAMLATMAPASAEIADRDVEAAVTRQVRTMLAESGTDWIGVSVAVVIEGRTLLFPFGAADRAQNRPVTADTLFNLGSVSKVFDTALLGQAVVQREIALDDPVAQYVTELQRGGDIRRVTLGQLASYTSGLVLPQDHPPWGDEVFTVPKFIAYLQAWKSDEGHRPGGQTIYSHSGFVLLHLALERRFGMPMHELMRTRILAPLGLAATTMPLPDADTAGYPRGRIPPSLARRAVQGYDEDGRPIGEPGNLQGFYHWLGTGQIYSSARDMAVFLAANLGQRPDQRALQDGMALAQRAVAPLEGEVRQGLAWEVRGGEPGIVDKFGGMNNASAFAALVPARKIGIVMLANRGSVMLPKAGRAILQALAAP